MGKQVFQIDPRVEQLISAFNKNGWKVKGIVDVSTDWWFDYIIELVSIWRPIGTGIYLTLLTEPQLLPSKIGWCIGISPTIPSCNHFTYLEQITLNDIKKTDLDLFVKKINKAILK